MRQMAMESTSCEIGAHGTHTHTHTDTHKYKELIRETKSQTGKCLPTDIFIHT